MVRQTSIDCYNKIKASGKLSARRLEVLEAIVNSSPCTASEALVFIKTSSLGIGSRFTELRDMGVIFETGTRKCKITNRNVIEWDLTGNMPVKIKKKKGRPRNFNKCIDYLSEGMDLRNWDVISKSMLIKLKISEDGIAKKKKV